MNIVERIYEKANRNAVALYCGEREVTAMTYGALLDAADALAQSLTANAKLREIRAAKITPRIGLSCPNSVEHVALALAILRAGACLVPIAGELSDRERATVVESTGLHAIISAKGGSWSLAKGVPQALEAASLAFELRANLKPDALAFDERKLSALNPAFIRFSSGTTGTSKGVALSHEALLARIEVANRRLAVSESDRVIWILPMAHHFAVSIMLFLVHGATTVIAPSHLAKDVLDAALQFGGTALYGSPFHHALLAAESSRRAWPGLRLAISTAAPLSLKTARDFDARFGVPLSQGLGVIEVGMPLLNTDAPREKPLSVGKARSDFEIELRDESGERVANGEIGEMFLRGAGMFDAYLAPWRLREEVAQDGWFSTGDLATMDAEGFVQICGRKKSVLNVAGMKCFPEEIEAVLREHPNVAVARVFGRENERVGQVPVAEIVLRDASLTTNSGELAAHCRSSLAAYKVPLEFRFVASLPLTASGKIKR